MADTQKKYQSLQIVRACAAWMVVMHHYQQMFFNYNYDNYVSWFAVKRGSFGIDLFFVLSGFVMFLVATKPGVSAGNFFFRRVVRIAPAYWFFTTVFIFWGMLFPKIYAYTDFNALSLLKSYFLVPGENPSGIGMLPFLTPGWSLIFEMVFYSTLAVCILLAGHFAVFLCFALITLSVAFFPDGYTYSPILGDWRILQFLVGFLIGWYISSPLYTQINKHIPLPLQYSLMLLGAAVIISGVFNFGLIQRSVTAALIIQAAILIDIKATYSNPLARFFIRSGDYSYSVYLSHVLVLGLFFYIFGAWRPWYLDLTGILGVFIVTHIVSALSYRFIENGRLVNNIKSLAPPGKPALKAPTPS